MVTHMNKQQVYRAEAVPLADTGPGQITQSWDHGRTNPLPEIPQHSSRLLPSHTHSHSQTGVNCKTHVLKAAVFF